MSQFWSDFVQRLEPYVPGEQPKILDLIKLNTNENPYPPSPKVREVLNAEVVNNLRLYPDPNSTALKAAVAEQCQVAADQVFVGNGSDEVLGLAFMAFFKQDLPLLFPDISYSFYPVYCNLFDITADTQPLAADFSIDMDAFDRPNGGIIFPNPNAPTGMAMPLAAIESLLQANPGSVILVDEAYIDFGGESAVSLVDSYPNLLVVQTLSKSRSLAGLRVGFAVGNAALIEGLDRVKNSFNSYPIDRLAEAAAVASLADQGYFAETTAAIIASRDWTQAQLETLGYEVLPSQANFVFAKSTAFPAAEVFARLREKKILVRYFNKPRIDQFLRISIGTQVEMQALVTALEEIHQDLSGD